jgi:hypothetical protein
MDAACQQVEDYLESDAATESEKNLCESIRNL